MNQQSQLICNPSLDFQTIPTPLQIQNRANRPTKAEQSVMDTPDGGGFLEPKKVAVATPNFFFFFIFEKIFYILYFLNKKFN
jgi:hypothetical protein